MRSSGRPSVSTTDPTDATGVTIGMGKGKDRLGRGRSDRGPGEFGDGPHFVDKPEGCVLALGELLEFPGPLADGVVVGEEGGPRLLSECGQLVGIDAHDVDVELVTELRLPVDEVVLLPAVGGRVDECRVGNVRCLEGLG